jgi:heme exporter protein D
MNWLEMFSMGGYGFYVWGSYIAALILLGGEVFLLLRRKQSLRNNPNSSATRERK